MITRFIAVNPECLEPEKYRRVARLLEGDGVIIFPTDTFYGLGASCFSTAAVDRIYSLKKRDAGKALPIVISDLEMADLAAREVPPVFAELAGRFWPGPLTLVLKAAAGLPKRLLGDGNTIALRVPALTWLRALIREAGFPVIATSANVSGERDVSTAEEALALFQGKVDLVIDGGRTVGVKPSTVLDLTGDRPSLVREGAVPRSALEEYL